MADIYSIQYYVDIIFHTLFRDMNGTPFALPQHFVEDQLVHKITPIYPVELEGQNGVSYQAVDIGSMDMQLDIGTTGSSAIRYASIESVADGGFSKVYNSGSVGPGYFKGLLDLTGIQLGQDARSNLRFQIKIQSDTWRIAYDQIINLLGIVRNVAGSTPPTTISNIQAMFDERYVKWNGNRAGAVLTLTSQDGLRQLGIYAANDGSDGLLKT
jgi:hypothetical protein